MSFKIKDTDLHLLELQPLRGDWQLGEFCLPPRGATLAAYGMLYRNPELIYELLYSKKGYVLRSGGYSRRLRVQTAIDKQQRERDTNLFQYDYENKKKA